MKKVGVVTFQYNNYGTKLQNYALLRSLEDMGIEAQSIYIKYRKDTFRAFVRSIIKHSLRVTFHKYRLFNHFNQKYLKRLGVTYRGAIRLDSTFDYFIVGSDQVWNPSHLLSRPKDQSIYFLRFASKDKRIAYAPSFGVANLDDNTSAIYSSALSQFRALSVRELSGSKMIKKHLGLNVPVVPDPTLLLDTKVWSALARTHKTKYEKQEYAAIYFLSDQPRHVRDGIAKYNADGKLSQVNIAGDAYVDGGATIVPGPDEFLSIIRYSKVLFTDSFHAIVFAIIFNIPFVALKRTDVEQHSRIENLLNAFKLESTYYSGGEMMEYVKSGIGVDTKPTLLTQRKIGIDYLRHALGEGRVS